MNLRPFYRALSIGTTLNAAHRGPDALARNLLRREIFRLVARILR